MFVYIAWKVVSEMRYTVSGGTFTSTLLTVIACEYGNCCLMQNWTCSVVDASMVQSLRNCQNSQNCDH